MPWPGPHISHFFVARAPSALVSRGGKREVGSDEAGSPAGKPGPENPALQVGLKGLKAVLEGLHHLEKPGIALE